MRGLKFSSGDPSCLHPCDKADADTLDIERAGITPHSCQGARSAPAPRDRLDPRDPASGKPRVNSKKLDILVQPGDKPARTRQF